MDTNQKVVIVGGCGHVGLPLGLILSDSGFNVTLLDKDSKKVDLVSNGKMPFIEPGCQELLAKHRKTELLSATTENEILTTADFVVIVIGTALNSDFQPDTKGIIVLLAEISQFLSSSQVIILRSTVYPGTTERLRDLYPNLNFVFCPERIAEGHAVKELRTIPQIVGISGRNEVDKKTSSLFERIGIEVLSTSAPIAELTKLFSNAWRYISFGAANEIRQVVERVGLDSNEIFKLMKYNYPRCDALPLPGFAGGPCLPKDTRQLSHFFENRFLLASAALAVHDSHPAFVISQLAKQHDLKRLTVGVLGMTFKPESDDLRGSQAVLLIDLLKTHAREVVVYDPFVSSPALSLEEVIEQSDVLVVATHHQDFLELKTSKLVYRV